MNMPSPAMIALRVPSFSLSLLVPSGHMRVVLVSMLLGPFAFVPFAMDSAWQGNEAATFALFLCALGGTIAGVVVLLFRMFRWVLDGFDGAGRRRLLQFGVVVLVAGFAAMFREEVSPPFPTTEGCWYSVRDRWTGNVDMRLAECSAEPKPRHQRGRILPVGEPGESGNRLQPLQSGVTSSTVG
jgi:hypothetical protein